MTIKLYVDYISPDSSVAVTTTPASVHHNLPLLSEACEQRLNLFLASKYVCVLEISADSKVVMNFLDIRANPGYISKFAKSDVLSDEHKEVFRELLEEVKESDEHCSTSLDLALGVVPDSSKK